MEHNIFADQWIEVGTTFRRDCLVKIFAVSVNEEGTKREARAKVVTTNVNGLPQEYGNFKIIENLTDVDDFKAGTVTVYKPTKKDEFGNWVAKYKRNMADLLITVRIGYLAAVGLTEDHMILMREDRYGQSCSQCSHLCRPYQGDPDLRCRKGMFDDIDMHELQLEKPEVVDLGGGRYFQAFSMRIKDDFGVEAADMPSWLTSIEQFDDAIHAICEGLAADLGGTAYDYVQGFDLNDVIDTESPDFLIDPVRLREVFEDIEMHPMFIALLLEENMTRAQYDIHPKTISHFYANCVAEEKGFGMDFISDDQIKAYNLDLSCPYGKNKFHKHGFTTQILEQAYAIRAKLEERHVPQIAMANVKDTAEYPGYLIVNADQPALRPTPDIESLPFYEFVPGYMNQLRHAYKTMAGFRAEIARILTHERILVVSEDGDKPRHGTGFEIVDGAVKVHENACIESRHILAFILKLVSGDKHELSKINY